MPSRGMVAALSVLVLTGAGGCRYEASLDGSGGGSMKIAYRIGKPKKVFAIKNGFASADVKVTSAAIDEGNHVVVEIGLQDITKLHTSPFFKNVRIARTERDGTVILTAVARNEHPSKVTKESLEYFGREVAVVVNCPGAVVGGNATTSSGNTARWSFDLEQVAADPELRLELRYRQPQGG